MLAMAVGQKQKTNVNEIVKKVIFSSLSRLSVLCLSSLIVCFILHVMQFPEDDFVVMLFHYDGVVDDWKDFEWSSRAIHVSAIHQTKW